MHWIKSLISRRPSAEREAAAKLHAAINVEARRADLFGGEKIPDTLDGRAAAIALFHGVVSSTLVAAGPQGRKTAEHLASDIFDSFDAALRETGVGDASIARKIRKLGEHFTGLGIAVTQALSATNQHAALQHVLVRNEVCTAQGAGFVAERLIDAHSRLAKQTDSVLLSGQTDWPSQQNAG